MTDIGYFQYLGPQTLFLLPAPAFLSSEGMEVYFQRNTAASLSLNTGFCWFYKAMSVAGSRFIMHVVGFTGLSAFSGIQSGLMPPICSVSMADNDARKSRIQSTRLEVTTLS